MICFSRQLSEVNFFQQDNLEQWNVVFCGIVDDTEGMENSLETGTKVGAGPEQSGVGISSRYLTDLLSLKTPRQELPKTLHAQCPRIL